MLTYRSFTTPLNLLDMLSARYDMPPPPDLTPPEQEAWKVDCQRVIRLRYELADCVLAAACTMVASSLALCSLTACSVFNVIKTWLKTYFYDFLESEDLRRVLEAFLEHMRSDPAYEKPGTQLKRIFDQRVRSSTSSGAVIWHALRHNVIKMAPYGCAVE